MTQYVFMNHRVRQRKPDGPVIVAVHELLGGAHQMREANEFELWVHGQKIGRVVYDPKPLPVCDTHEVKAWIELDDIVIVRRQADAAARAPAATAKRPNRKVAIKP